MKFLISSDKYRKNASLILLGIIALVIFFSFGAYRLGKFITIDEHLWLYKRIPQYWAGITTQNWKLTYVHEKPGITLAIISGAGLLQYDHPSEYVSANRPSKTQSTLPMENFLVAFRLPLLIFNGISSLFFFWIIRRITADKWIALWSSALILFSPVLLGMTRIVNADALLWTFATACLLSFVAYLQSEEKKMILLTSLFLGLSLLTKFVAVIFFPFLFTMAVLFCFSQLEIWKRSQTDIPLRLKRFASAYLLIIFGSVILFSMLLPASLFNWKYVYRGTIGFKGMPPITFSIIALCSLILLEHRFWKNRFSIRILDFFGNVWRKYSRFIFSLLAFSFLVLIVNYLSRLDFLKLEDVPFDARQAKLFYKSPFLKKILLEFRPVVFSLTPLVLFSVLFLWIKASFRKTNHLLLVSSLSLFFVAFSLAVIEQRLLNTVRYSIIVYPSFSILAAIGVRELLSSEKLKRISFLWATSLIILLSLASLWLIKPFYLTYANDLLPKKYVISDPWGYGGYEAAQYLNSLPNARNLAAWSDRGGFCEFFIGKCVKSTCKLPEGYSAFDYHITTRRGEILHVEEAASYYRAWKKTDYRICKKNPAIFEGIKKSYTTDQDPVFQQLIDGRPGSYVNVFSQ